MTDHAGLNQRVDFLASAVGDPDHALAVARHYGSLLDGMVIDVADESLAPTIEAEGPRVAVTGTVMNSAADRAGLAEAVVQFAKTLEARR